LISSHNNLAISPQEELKVEEEGSEKKESAYGDDCDNNYAKNMTSLLHQW
jgi:hypothetical protein